MNVSKIVNESGNLPLEHLFRRYWKCPNCGEKEKPLWVLGKIRIMPATKLAGRVVFQILSEDMFTSYWVCENAPNAVAENDLVVEVRDWEMKGLGVYMIGPCGNAEKEQYCLYPENEKPEPVPYDSGRYLQLVDPRALDQQLDQQPQEEGPINQPIEGPAF